MKAKTTEIKVITTDGLTAYPNVVKKTFGYNLKAGKYNIEHHEGSWFAHTNHNAVNWQVLKLEPDIEPLWENLIQFIL